MVARANDFEAFSRRREAPTKREIASSITYSQYYVDTALPQSPDVVVGDFFRRDSRDRGVHRFRPVSMNNIYHLLPRPRAMFEDIYAINSCVGNSCEEQRFFATRKTATVHETIWIERGSQMKVLNVPIVQERIVRVCG
ncbi:MAG TPA: hypothetical protein VGM18_13610 [Candidatus Sulfotelmatobacter sp.]|jgi:hypothetical protein